MPICANCGHDNPDDARFCSACGQRLDPVARAGERKLVTVLFADVARSTELADRLDAEDLREVMSEWFALVRSEVDAQGGTVEKYIGDAVMAVFGVPHAHEDDPARALRAALAIRERLVALNARLEAAYGLGLEVRTGINTGEAVTTLEPAPGEALVTGVAVNAAARLEQLAEPGQTLVAERTARAALGFRFEELGALQLRGKHEPVRAFLLVDAIPEARTRGLPGMQAPLIGRDRELALLLALVERVAAERRPQLVTIYGDPGVGKSRLVRELLQRLGSASDAPRVVVGRCLSYGDAATYWPLAEILKSLAALSDDAPARVAVERIEALVDDVLDVLPPETRAVTSAALAFTLGLDTANAVFARLQPSAIRAELHRAWLALLSALAEREPLLVVIDDIHWADPVLLDLLEELAGRAEGPLLIACPARPELTDNRPTWGGGRRNFSSVFLSPLTEDAAGELVAHLLDVDGLREDTRAQILTRAEGNPFFLEEILRQLIDEGLIVRENGRWHAAEELPELHLPDTVQAVLAARIDLLQPREKRTLQRASVVGRIFWRGAVAALVDDSESVDADLRRLEDRELVASRLGSSIVGEDELAFRHILTRDVAYESMPRRERPRAHERVARWIEQTAGDRRREYVGLLAHHYAEAYRGARRDRSYEDDEREDLRQRAFGLLVEAAWTAIRGAAYRAARSLAESALDVAATPGERATALETLGDGFRHAALGDGAWESYSRAVDALREGGSTDYERIGRLSGLALETVVRWAGTMKELPPEEVARRYFDAAVDQLGGDDGEARVRLMTAEAFWGHGYPGTTSPYSEPDRAEATGRAAVEIAKRIGRPDLAVVALDSVQHNLQRQLRYVAAHDAALERLELARTAGDLGELGDSYAVAAWNAAYLGSFESARDTAAEGYELLLAHAPLYAVHALSWGVLGSFYLGDWDRALSDFERVVVGLGERGEVLTTGFSSPWPVAAFVHEARGERGASEALLGDLYALEGRSRRASARLAALVVPTLVLRGDLEAARRRIDEVLRAEQRPDHIGLLLLGETELVLQEGGPTELRQFAERVRATAATTGALYLPPAAEQLEGRAALAAGDADGAVRLLRDSAAGFAALGMAVHDSAALLDVAEALVACGRGGDASAPAAEARSTFERIGYRRELERASSLLDAATRTNPTGRES